MWQERFNEMQVKVDTFLRAYKNDFEVDKKTITTKPEDTFLWMLRETGTQLVNLTEVQNGEYKINDSGYPERTDGAVDDGSAESQNWRYLICDQADLDNGKKPWGYRDTSEGLDGTVIGVGLPNTEAMIAKYGDDDTRWWKLIKEKRDSTSFNWFMPSKDELDMMYDDKTVITSQGGDVFSTDAAYWSSSEYNSDSVSGEWFDTGGQHNFNKADSGHCRLIRRV